MSLRFQKSLIFEFFVKNHWNSPWNFKSPLFVTDFQKNSSGIFLNSDSRLPPAHWIKKGLGFRPIHISKARSPDAGAAWHTTTRAVHTHTHPPWGHDRVHRKSSLSHAIRYGLFSPPDTYFIRGCQCAKSLKSKYMLHYACLGHKVDFRMKLKPK